MATRDDSGDKPPRAPFELVIETELHHDDWLLLEKGLSQHAVPYTPGAGFKPLAVLARDTARQLVGGAYGTVNWNWLHVSRLWVADPLRGQGLGSRLLSRIETEGAARGCTDSHLDTFSYQARPFYERHGYEVFGVLTGYPPPHQRFFLRKSLARPDHGPAAGL